MSRRRAPSGTSAGGQFLPGEQGRASLTLVPYPGPGEEDLLDVPTGRAPLMLVGDPPQGAPGRLVNGRGSRYTGWRPVAAIARDLRADIRAARENGQLPLPEHATVSVKASTFSMGQGLTLQVRGLSYDEIYGLLRPDGRRGPGYSASTQDTIKALEEMASAYDKPDPGDRPNHYTTVSVRSPHTAALVACEQARNDVTATEQKSYSDIRPVAVGLRVSPGELADWDVTEDPRCAQLPPDAKFAVLTAQEAIRVAKDRLREAEELCRLLAVEELLIVR